MDLWEGKNKCVITDTLVLLRVATAGRASCPGTMAQRLVPGCLHQDVMKLACSDNQIDVIYGFFGALCLMVDFMLIAVSYILILKTVLGIALSLPQFP